jgi:5'-phosphate synthase pdxT subunit
MGTNDARVGVLALQGSSEPHLRAFERLGVGAREMRGPNALAELTHLVLPGGESTTLQHLLALFGLQQALVERFRAGELALFCTCAGAILHGRDEGEAPPRIGLLDATVRRNAYGRQVDSFTAELALEHDGGSVHGVFMRAPRVEDVGPNVRVHARHGDEPVLLHAPGILAASFHPELTDDPTLHRFFLERVGAMEPTASLP